MSRSRRRQAKRIKPGRGDRAREPEHLESQQRAAEAKTAAVEQQIKVFDEVPTSILPLSPLSVERLKVVPKFPNFDPGRLRIASPMPDWNEYAPIEPGGLSRMFGGTARHERRTAEARIRYEAAMSDYRQRCVPCQDFREFTGATPADFFARSIPARAA